MFGRVLVAQTCRPCDESAWLLPTNLAGALVGSRPQERRMPQPSFRSPLDEPYLRHQRWAALLVEPMSVLMKLLRPEIGRPVADAFEIFGRLCVFCELQQVPDLLH
jgi:hypothetical protein